MTSYKNTKNIKTVQYLLILFLVFSGNGTLFAFSSSLVTTDPTMVYGNIHQLMYDKKNLSVSVINLMIVPGYTHENTKKNESRHIFNSTGLYLAGKYKNIALGVGTTYTHSNTAYENYESFGFDLASRGSIISAAPTIAFGITENIFIVGGVSFVYYHEYKSKNLFLNENPELVSYDTMKASGISEVVGNCGAMYRYKNILSVGFQLKMPSKSKLEGSYIKNDIFSDTQLASGDFTLQYDLPFTYTLYAEYRWKPYVFFSAAFIHGFWSQVAGIETSHREASGVFGDTAYKENADLNDIFAVILSGSIIVSRHFMLSTAFQYYNTGTGSRSLNPFRVDVSSVTTILALYYFINRDLILNISGLYSAGLEREYNNQKFDNNSFGFYMGVNYSLNLE